MLGTVGILIVTFLSNYALAYGKNLRSNQNFHKSYDFKRQLLTEDLITFDASPDCPCINPWSDPTIAEIAANCRNVTWHDSSISCVPLNYGASVCDYWDTNITLPNNICDGTFCETDEKEENSYSWCFVDKENCERSATQLNMGNVSMYKSFATCGNLGEYSDLSTRNILNGLKLRVSFPPDSGYNLLTTSTGEKAGATIDFMEHLRAIYGFSWEVTEITNKSLARYSHSPFTACIHDVALNETDICIGPFWATDQRLLLTTFTSSLYNNMFYLVSPKAKDASFLDLMNTPFVPFTANAWYVLGATVIYVAFAVSLIQDNKDERNKKYLDSGRVIRRTGNTVFNAVTSFANGGLTNESDEPNVAEKIVIAGFSVFALIVLTAYTASSAAALVNTGGGGVFASIDDVLRENAKMCVNKDMMPTISNIYEEVSHLLVPVDYTHELMPAMDAGKCTVGIMLEDDFNAIMAQDDSHCNKILAGSVLFTVPTSFPINREYQEPFIYAISKSVNEGEFEEFRESNKAKYVGESLCRSDSEEEADGDIVRLSVIQLLFPIVLTVICTTIGLIVQFRSSAKKAYRDSVVFIKSHSQHGRELLSKDVSLSNNKGQTDSSANGDDDNFEIMKKDQILKNELNKHSTSELLDLIDDSSSSIEKDDDVVEKAIDSLPDTSKLVDIVFEQNCSVWSKNVIFLNKQSTSKLKKLAESSFSSVDPMSIKIALEDEVDPRRCLIELLLSSKESRELLLRCNNKL